MQQQQPSCRQHWRRRLQRRTPAGHCGRLPILVAAATVAVKMMPAAAATAMVKAALKLQSTMPGEGPAVQQQAAAVGLWPEMAVVAQEAAAGAEGQAVGTTGVACSQMTGGPSVWTNTRGCHGLKDKCKHQSIRDR